jgi:diguanylate cyclase (GGDEF)-like protein
MEPGFLFGAVSVVTLANGAILAVISSDLPPAMRPAARYWQIGTLLFAIGCALASFNASRPSLVTLVGANGLFIFGLTAYYAAVRRFDGLHSRAWLLLPGLLATACVLWFSIVAPDVRLRLAAFSIVLDGLVIASMATLWREARGDFSLSRRILIGLFGVVAASTCVRMVVFLGIGFGPRFSLADVRRWLEVLTPIFIAPMLPALGTTAFQLMFADKLRRQLEAAAATDYLTGLPNRRSFTSSAEERFAKGWRGAGFAVAILDVDNFKQINDSHGHHVGDQALAHVAACLRQHMRRFDMIARIGGEEFAALLNCHDLAEAHEAVSRLRLAVEESEFVWEKVRMKITLSAGLTAFYPDDKMFDDMLHRADRALYSAKAAGRNRVETLEPRGVVEVAA